MNESENLVPKRRFKEFTNTGTWGQRKSKEICTISTGKGNTQDKIDDGKYPFYVRSATIERSNDYLYDQEAVLTVGDGVGTGKVFHYVNGKYNLHQRVYRMFDFNNEVSAKYFYYYFSKKFYRRVMAMTAKTSVDSVRLEMIADMIIEFPSPKEQQKIVKLFESLDDAIALHQRQLDNYKELKKAMMQNIFNKKLRFKNGNGNEFPEWKKKKLNNFCSVTTGKLDANAMKANGVYKFFTCSHQDYLIDTYAFEGESLIIAGNGDVGHIKYYNGKFNAYQRTYILQNFENISAVYLKNNLENELPRRIQRETQQSAMVYIKLSTLTEAEIDVPIMEEQNIIGDFLSKFDSMIAKQEKIIDLFKEQKKVLMQKMFV